MCLHLYIGLLNTLLYICKQYNPVYKFTMVNIDEFAGRIQKVIDYYSLSASGFADKVGVQRSSISHILSGRNKPSLDFVMKILKAFPEVDLYWLLNGKGTFPKSETPPPVQKVETPTPTDSQNLFTEVQSEKKEVEASTNIPQQPQKILERQISSAEKEIDKVIIFYKDGTYQLYKN